MLGTNAGLSTIKSLLLKSAAAAAGKSTGAALSVAAAVKSAGAALSSAARVRGLPERWRRRRDAPRRHRARPPRRHRDQAGEELNMPGPQVISEFNCKFYKFYDELGIIFKR